VALVILFVLMLLAGGAILLGLTRVSSGLSAALTTSPTITLTAIGGGATHTLTPAVALTVLPAKTGLPPTPTVTPTVPITPSPALPTAPPVPTAIPTINAPTLAAPTEQTGSGISQAGITLITVAGGAFMMGSDANPAEKPVHSVGLAPFYIDQFEVTNAAWAACVAAGACHLPGSTESYDHKPYYGVDAYNNYPVVFVSWYSAGAYCRWRGARLPSEAEWEMAARWNPGSGATSVYPWGDDWNPANLNACDASCLLSGSAFKDPQYDDGQPQMAPVGSFPMDVSSLGVSDMGGNVAEWVADGYDAAYYAVSPAENPTGPATGAEKVVRGGSWSLDKNWARGAARSHFGPLAQFAGIGFRCALTAAAQ
jgi:formylglycine-generating enzyme required for sulfatase activity